MPTTSVSARQARLDLIGEDETLIFADGLDDAILGIAEYECPPVVYDNLSSSPSTSVCLPPPDTADLDLWEPDPQNPQAIKLEPDAWGSSRDQDKAIENAVARIARARVQTSLPQFAICYPDKIEFGRQINSVPSRPVEMLSRHLFTIDWAMTAPGLSWPEAYRLLTWLPGVERWLVTASRDSPEVGGNCDTALDHFGAEQPMIEGAGSIIIGMWGDHDQQHWEVFFEAGMIGRCTAEAWADKVWMDPEPLDEDVELEGGL